MSECKAFQKLFKRSWFHRQWCFQEIVIAKKATVVCGTFDIHWEALWNAVSGIMMCENAGKLSGDYVTVETAESCVLTAFCRENYHLGDKEKDEQWLDLMNLVVLCMDRKAALPHDKIYALLGCAQGDGIHSIPVDYQQHFRRLYGGGYEVVNIEPMSRRYVRINSGFGRRSGNLGGLAL